MLASASGYKALPQNSLHSKVSITTNRDIEIMDIIAINQDTLLVPLRLTIPQFLFVYKTSNKLPLLPTPSVQCNFQNVIDQINGDSTKLPHLTNKEENLIVSYNPNQ